MIHYYFLMVSCGAFDEEAEIDHDKKLSAFLDRAQERNIGLNAKNVKLKMTEFPCIGHLLRREGLLVDSKKVEAIENMSSVQLTLPKFEALYVRVTVHR